MSAFCLWARGVGCGLAARRSYAVAAVLLAAAVVLACSPGLAAAASGPPVLAFSPSPYDFGTVKSGDSVSRTFKLSNSGGSAVAPVITVKGSSAFAVDVASDMCTATVLGPGQTCTVQVRFAPSGSGTAKATLMAVSRNPAATATDELTGAGPSDHLYWTDRHYGEIMEANVDGTNPHAIVTGQINPTGVAVNVGHIYWTNYGSNGAFAGEVMEANLDGTDRRVVASGHNVEHPLGVAVNGSHLYWVNGGDESTPSSVVQADLDGTHQHLLDAGGQVSGLAVDDKYVYFSFLDPEDAGINRISLTDQRSETIVGAPPTRISGVAVDAGHLYWAEQDANKIMKANLDGSDPHTIASGNNVEVPDAVAVAGGHLYWTNLTTDEFGGQIVRANLDGSDQKQIVTDITEPAGVAVGPQGVTSRGSNACVLPRLTGTPLNVVRRILPRLGCRLGTIIRRPSTSTGQNAVVRTNPPAGTYRRNRVIDLVVSDGPAPAGVRAGQSVAGSGTNDDPYTVPKCSDFNADGQCFVIFPLRYLKTGISSDFVPAYRCPGDRPWLLKKTVTQGRIVPPGVSFTEEQGNLGVNITGVSTRVGKEITVGNKLYSYDYATGTKTGFPNSSVTNWDFFSTGSYRIIIYCTDDLKNANLIAVRG